jgi:hypothetical protein
MKQNPDVSQMAYGDWLFVLGSGNQKDADAVWAFLNGKGIPVSSPEHPAKVIAATADELQLATTDDDIQESKADVTLKLTKPLPAAQVPQAGTMLAGRWVGKATSYNALPPAQPAQNAAGGQQPAATSAQTPPAGCMPNTGGGVMLTLTEGTKQEPPSTKKAPPRRTTTTHKKTTTHH